MPVGYRSLRLRGAQNAPVSLWYPTRAKGAVEKANVLGTDASTRSPSSALLPTFWGEGSPTKIRYSKRGTLIPTSLLEDLVQQFRLSRHDIGNLAKPTCAPSKLAEPLSFYHASGLNNVKQHNLQQKLKMNNTVAAESTVARTCPQGEAFLTKTYPPWKQRFAPRKGGRRLECCHGKNESMRE